MSLLSQTLFNSRIRTFCYYPQTRFKQPGKPIRVQAPTTHIPNSGFRVTRLCCVVKAFESDGAAKVETLPDSQLNFDDFLSVLEFICLVSSAAVSIALVVNSWVLRRFGNRVLVGQCVVLVAAMVIGALIRRRQWQRICCNFSRSKGSAGVNLVERIEKLEEDLRSSGTMIRVLSRQLEKLGIRFRVTRRNLKGPITETAALAQKNSEATRALAVQGEILEKELGEIQKVLLAMQDQQQKQLELILAIGKTSKLWDNSEGTNQDRSQNQNAPSTASSSVDGVPNMRLDQMQTVTVHEANVDQV